MHLLGGGRKEEEGGGGGNFDWTFAENNAKGRKGRGEKKGFFII